MKIILTTCTLFVLASSAMACDLTGVKGAISNDGQAITARQSILLKDQARTYGGYERAAAYMAQNRLEVLKNASYSQAVKDQVSNDMLKNTQDLKCWALACNKDRSDPGCQL
ncbi:hypothetical protein Bsp3421_004240 [Burkholderia sp. FERM BP-3421]|jgi:hypothetical protein|uniref:hypothetical protein n=1 Tax=Burkholderia sp. FERM BP-3421 TaxID=1494466 RepID=UPI00235F90FF|nr:hypothetical protein [Burkholderia sp. FERM BP-3421]WDD94129.1 hypothetical protein Bsp3421_004240 [Burkholderia sp. FERM BP-3421]